MTFTLSNRVIAVRGIYEKSKHGFATRLNSALHAERLCNAGVGPNMGP